MSVDLKPLNPTLYFGLQRLLESRGDESLEIYNAGMGCVEVAVRDPQARRDSNKKGARTKVMDAGEEYRFNCPFCGDTRQRMYVSHLWGVPDKDGNGQNLWRINCWNEKCNSDFDNIRWLFDQIYKVNSRRAQPVRLHEGKQRTMEEILAPKNPPGTIIRLDALAKQDPKHFAVEYIIDRGFDPAYLGKTFGVGYCPTSEFALARRRIYVPIEMDGKLMGWQCRYPGAWSKGMPAKYFSCPQMRKRYMAYNYNRALRYKTIEVVEGPFDVFGAGSNAFGLLGKAMSVHMRERLIKDIDPRSYLAIMLDPKSDKLAVEDGRPHHIETLYNLLEPYLRERVFKVYLPEEFDPGSLERSVQHDLIRDAAREAGLKKISFRKLDA